MKTGERKGPSGNEGPCFSPNCFRCRSGLFQDFFLELLEELVFLHPVRAEALVEVGAQGLEEPLPDRFPSPKHDIFEKRSELRHLVFGKKGDRAQFD